jgi:TPR repeat protein
MELGDIFRQKGGEANLAKAATYYERAARRGDREAPYWLGVMRESGQNAPGRCADQNAYEWYELAAARGNRKAQSRLAEMYREGDGVGKDLVVAAFYQMAELAPQCHCAVAQHRQILAQFVLKAANQGHAEAQYRIARMLYEGTYIAKDEAAAALWMRKAAIHG